MYTTSGCAPHPVGLHPAPGARSLTGQVLAAGGLEAGFPVWSHTSTAEAALVEVLLGWWAIEWPGWVHLDWLTLRLRPQVRDLLPLAPGPELITALAAIPAGPCPQEHTGYGLPGDPNPGSTPGFPCPCQLVIAAAWDAATSWTALRTDAAILIAAGAEPVWADTGGRAGTEACDLAREELAPMLLISPASADTRLRDARALHATAEVADLVATGALRIAAARRIAADLGTLAAAERAHVGAALTEAITDRARRGLRPWTGTEARAAARRTRARLGSTAEAKARRGARAARRVWLTPDVDGMAWLGAYLPETDATRIYHRLTAQAKALRHHHPTPSSSTDTGTATTATTGSAVSCPECAADGGARSTDQIRADLLTDLLLTHPASPTQPGTAASPTSSTPTPTPTPYADISVVIDLATLLGLAHNPAEIPGLGPIPADIARELAADGTWRAWITTTTGTATTTGTTSATNATNATNASATNATEDGSSAHTVLIATSPGTYTPGAALARLIRAREPYCRMPGCRTRAEHCDLDHTIPFPAPPGTTEQNLGPLCRRHHNFKTHHGFTLTPHPTNPTNCEPGDPSDPSDPETWSPEHSATTLTDGWTWTMPSGITHHDHPPPR